jgi:hypothetical protein
MGKPFVVFLFIVSVIVFKKSQQAKSSLEEHSSIEHLLNEFENDVQFGQANPDTRVDEKRILKRSVE